MPGRCRSIAIRWIALATSIDLLVVRHPVGLSAPRTDRYKFICCQGIRDIDEFHDLQEDPLEGNNLMHPKAADFPAELAAPPKQQAH